MLTAILVISFFTSFQEPEYYYQHVPNMRVTSRLGKGFCEGTLLEDGSFEPDLEFLSIKKSNPLAASGALAPNYNIGYRDKQPLYEFRCRLLIPMIYDENLGIIPEVGGRIIDFKDYKYSPTARRIYNLPGRFVLKKDEPEKKP